MQIAITKYVNDLLRIEDGRTLTIWEALSKIQIIRYKTVCNTFQSAILFVWSNLARFN